MAPLPSLRQIPAEWSWQRKIARRRPPPTTMTNDDIQILYEYHRWANNRVLQAASTLSAEEFTRDLGGSFRSVRDTLVHIVGSESTWLAYWIDRSPSSAFLTDLWTRHDTLFSPNAFPDLAAVRQKWAEVEKEQIEFVNRVTHQSLGESLGPSTSQPPSQSPGQSLTRMLPVGTTQISLAHLMQHLANHSTYHRGQVALMMRQLAATPLATDFAMFLMEGH